MTPAAGTIPTLDQVLRLVANDITEHGTRSRTAILEALSAAACALCPAAAAALVDWDDPEITRLRAYGLVHRALLRGHPADRDLPPTTRRSPRASVPPAGAAA